jgi:anti-anti-sigma regulatory factor
MLRVSYAATSEGQQWTLSGRLSGPEVEELRWSWQQAHERAPHARGVVDLRDVTFIDESGRNLLAEMDSAGAEFLVAGVENRQTLATLQENGKRPCKPLSAPSWAPR